MENEKMFTQDEVNTIVQERLSKEKAKYDRILAEKEAEYNKRERFYQAKDELSRRGIPAELASLVQLDTDDSFNNSISLLEKNYKQPIPHNEPVVHGKTPENRGCTTPQGGFQTGDPIRNAMGL